MQYLKKGRCGLGVGILLAILFMLVGATPALAHRLLVFAYAEDKNILVESKLVPDTPVKEGKVVVSDKQTGQVLVTGQTDAHGKFSFPIPAEAAARRADLLIVVEAGMGHKGEWLLKAEKYLPGGAAASPAAPAPALTSPPAAVTPAGLAPTAPTLDPQALEAVVSRVVAREIAPLKEMVAELSVHRTSLTDIIGGLGYILGIFGIWAYFLSKRQGKA